MVGIRLILSDEENRTIERIQARLQLLGIRKAKSDIIQECMQEGLKEKEANLYKIE